MKAATRAIAPEIQRLLSEQYSVLDCEHLVAIAARPIYNGGICNDCLHPVIAGFALHRPNCFWLEAARHVRAHGCGGPAHRRAFRRGWKVFDGDRR